MLGAHRIPHRLYRLRCFQHGMDLSQDQLLDGLGRSASGFAGLRAEAQFEDRHVVTIALTVGFLGV